MKRKVFKAVFLAIKIGLGTAMAIFIASLLQLDNPTAAGTITLLTLLTTKRKTAELSLQRIITFVINVLISLLLFTSIESSWAAFGIQIACMVLITELCNWQGTLSVNALIGIHFLQTHDFSIHFIMNEFILLLIGIVLALSINQIQFYNFEIYELNKSMRETEDKIKELLKEIVYYINHPKEHSKVWDELDLLEKKIQLHLIHAIEYQENTYISHPQYFIDYFEMREFQCEILHMLHYELRKIRKMPEQAHVISDYIEYLIPFVSEYNEPTLQIERLHELLDGFKEDHLPKTKEEFENRAILYHIFMDLEDFLLRKKKFIDEVSDEQKELYWK